MSDLSIRFDELEDEGFFLSPDSKSKQKEKEKNDSFSRAVKIIFIILSVCVFLEFLFYKFIIPSIEAPVVSVTGQDSYAAEEIVEFQERLLSKGVSTSIRLARGDDELAACGQLGRRGD